MFYPYVENISKSANFIRNHLCVGRLFIHYLLSRQNFEIYYMRQMTFLSCTGRNKAKHRITVSGKEDAFIPLKLLFKLNDYKTSNIL